MGENLVDVEAQHAAHRATIWGLAYRMTGSAADADDVVQETFIRLMERVPDASRSLRPWLVQVAVNLSRDKLRRRRVRQESYVGPWLPEPVDTAALQTTTVALRESARFAFLVALEVLTPLQRGVLLLRDVFELSTRETAEALEVSVENAKVTLHRARAALRGASADAPDGLSEPALVWGAGSDDDGLRRAMAGLFAAILSGDVAAATSMLAADVRARTDAGGHYSAATRVVSGADHVVKLLLGILRTRGEMPEVTEVSVNGEVAWIIGGAAHSGPARVAPRSLVLLSLDPAGAIADMFSVLNPEKLTALGVGA